jgi:hypothetical protein
MLVFIDESGDSGLKLEHGSSKYFTIALVAFEDREEAIACDQRICLLKRELGWSGNSEFHFNKNSIRVRKIFLEAVLPYDFFYYGVVIDKDPKKLYGQGFRNKKSFYKYACSLVFENAKEKMINATVVIDESGSSEFKAELAKYLKQKTINGAIKKVKMQNSAKNNLLQLADYVVGAINRSMKAEKKENDEPRKILAAREIYVQIWPK